MQDEDRIERVGAKWQAPGAGKHYRGARFGSRRARERDPLAVRALLARCEQVASVLDAPCGAGRLREAITATGARWTGVDVSHEMLSAIDPRAGARRARASLAALPFRERQFDAVVCCRFLHHLHGEEALERAARELARVSRRYVIASFWDSASLPALRVRLGLKRSEGPSGRAALSRARLAASFERAGLRVLAYRSSLRFVSQQTFVLLERIERAP